jgi:hypothetical protein
MPRERKGTADDEMVFIPSIDGNRDDPDPFTVTIKPMTAGEMLRIERSLGDFTSAKINFAERAQTQVKSLLSSRVVSVHGYTVTHPKTGERVCPRNGAELYAAIMSYGDDKEASIIDEIVAAIKDVSKLKEGLREQLGSQSGQ